MLSDIFGVKKKKSILRNSHILFQKMEPTLIESEGPVTGGNQAETWDHSVGTQREKCNEASRVQLVDQSLGKSSSS